MPEGYQYPWSDSGKHQIVVRFSTENPVTLAEFEAVIAVLARTMDCTMRSQQGDYTFPCVQGDISYWAAVIPGGRDTIPTCQVGYAPHPTTPALIAEYLEQEAAYRRQLLQQHTWMYGWLETLFPQSNYRELLAGCPSE
jgi:hypothetical protein